MRKIIPFLLFIPLLVLSIYIGFTQFKNIKNNTIKNGVTINTSNGVEKSIRIPTDVPNFSTPTPKQGTANISTDQINLTISSPESGAIIDTNTVIISGSTQSNASVVINDVEIVANKDGSFKSSVPLDEGDNYISIVAYNDFGNVAEREIIVTRTIVGL